MENKNNIEEWKDIEGYEGLYQVSNLGNVKSLEKTRIGNGGSIVPVKERILKASKDSKGYLQVKLFKDEKPKTYKVHRLVASAFLPNPDNLPQVNHKDENPSNNRVDNLEWCSAKYNSNYGTRNERVAKSLTNHPMKSKKVAQIDKHTGQIIKIWESFNECNRKGFFQNAVNECCRGKRKTYKGFIWKYLSDIV